MAEEVDMTKRKSGGTKKRKAQVVVKPAAETRFILDADGRTFWQRVADFFRGKP
jgi:hypothetical protein